MEMILRRISLTYSAGCIGALVNSWLVWYTARNGIPQKLGVAMAPVWSLDFLYSRLFWGGIWGFLFMVPVWQNGFRVGVFSRGILFSTIPTLFQLFYVFPYVAGKGWMGLALGRLTPVLVFLYNSVWGFCAALWLYAAGAKR